MNKFMSSLYKDIKEYIPGEQPRDTQYVKLNTNELPYSPSPLVIKALNESAVSRLNLYSDPTNTGLKAKLSQVYGLDTKNIFISNGSDEVLAFAFMALYERGVAYADITYGLYKVLSGLYHVDTKVIPLAEDFSLVPEDYIGIDRGVVIANPNAPTGMCISLSDIKRIVESNRGHVVLIDEAYVDFGGESAISLVKDYDNLLVVRTYSKSFGMAGARLGYAFASEEIIQSLEKIKNSINPYNINSLTQKAGEAALCDMEYHDDCCKKIIASREILKKELEKLGFEVKPSCSNFLFARHNGIPGKELYLSLKAKGVLIRHFDAPEICQYNRISVGTPEQNGILVNKIKEILSERK